MAQQLSEVEVLVEELEHRVERLRALFEMYFMGIEKIEPSVARKDVDRRFYVLRRTQIRNTALRFRFLNVLLRYNTYQTYWMRISRKIEEGTYKRDVRRANARFSNPAQKKKGEESYELSDDDLSEMMHDTAPPSAIPRGDDSAAAALSQRGAQLDDELRLDGDALDLDVDDDEFNPGSGWLESQLSRAVLRPAPVPKEVRPTEQAPRPRGPLEAMSTQREIWIGKPPGKRPSSRPTTRPPSNSRPPKARHSSAPAAKEHPAKEAPAPAPARAGMRYAQGPTARRQSEIPIPGRASAAGPAATGRAPPPPAAPPPRKKSRPSMPKVEAPKPAVTSRAAPRPQPSVAAKVAKDPNLSDERVRQIYTQYVDTKRSLKESTASLTFESLAKSLRDSSDKLRTKHTGKSVDFEVAVKDGKTILRPVVK